MGKLEAETVIEKANVHISQLLKATSLLQQNTHGCMKYTLHSNNTDNRVQLIYQLLDLDSLFQRNILPSIGLKLRHNRT